MKHLFFKQWIFILFCVVTCFANNEPLAPEGNGTKESPYRLTCLENLVWMGQNIAECKSNVFLLDNDIDASETKNWEDEFLEIGNAQKSKDGKEHSFCGVLDGQNYSILNMYSTKATALISKVSKAEIKNLFLENITWKRTGGLVRGGLVNSSDNSVITNVHVSGVIYAGSDTGGVIASAKNTKVYNCSFSGLIYSENSARIGGIACSIDNSDVRFCKTSGYIECNKFAKNNWIGGICGGLGYDSYIRYSYADMKISANGFIGGISYNALQNREDYYGYVHTNDFGIMQCYATCSADKSCDAVVGGICAVTTNDCVCFSSYYDSNLMKGTDFGTGVSTLRMKRKATFRGWDFDHIWSIRENETPPYFKFAEDAACTICVFSSDFGKIELTPRKNKYAYGENVLINAIPDEKEKTVFLEYKKDLLSKEPSVSLSVEKDMVIEANFAKYISEPDDLNKIGVDNAYPLSGHYLQSCDLDMRETKLNKPIGEYSSRFKIYRYFTGIYDGQNYTIDNLALDLTNSYVYAGLFCCSQYAEIKNIRLANAKFRMKKYNTGGILIGLASNTQISNCFVEGNFELASSGHNGGICGQMQDSELIRCGFKGETWIFGCRMGGLSGYAFNSAIKESSANITDMLDSNDTTIAGLVVSCNDTSFVNCYTKGLFNSFVFNNNNNYGSQNVVYSNCYADVHELSYVLDKDVKYYNCYFNSDYVYPDGEISNMVSPEDMKKQETYVGWDFDEIWDIDEGVGTPYFRYALPEPVGMFALLLLAFMAMKKR